MAEIESVMHELGARFAAGNLAWPGATQTSLIAHGTLSQTYDGPALIGRWGELSGNDVSPLLRLLRARSSWS